MTPEVQIVREGRGFVYATWGRFQIACYRERIDPNDLKLMRSHSQKLIAQVAPEKILTISVSHVTMALPDDETRKLAAESMAKVSPFQVASATVLEGEGFRASAARAAFAGMILLSRSSMSQKAFGQIEEAATWLAGMGRAEKPVGDELARITRALREKQMSL